MTPANNESLAQSLTAAQLAAKIDHTLLKPEATRSDVDAVIEDALQHRFASVCVQPIFVKHVADRVRGSGVKACCVISFPHGASRPTVKAIEAVAAAKDGAEEVDVVAHLPYLRAKDVASARAELSEVVRGVRAVRKDVVVKVIIESAAVTSGLSDADAEAVIAAACQAVRESGCDFIKTSTGFHPAGGAAENVVRWMKKHADGLQVKASGGIRDLAGARLMLAAGADRLGMSAGVAVLNELQGAEPTGGSGY